VYLEKKKHIKNYSLPRMVVNKTTYSEVNTMINSINTLTTTGELRTTSILYWMRAETY